MERDPLLNTPQPKRRRRLHPLMTLLIGLVSAAGIAYLWFMAFSPLFISPHEFTARQRAFDRVVRRILTAHGDGEIPNLPLWPEPLSTERVRVLACAEAQIAKGVRHTNSTQSVAYPWGDLPPDLGTSADLIVRCVRETGLDLQQMVHQDRKVEVQRYPVRVFGRRAPERGMDHRRVAFLFPFLRTFFPEKPTSLTPMENLASFQPGDIVVWRALGREGHPGLAGIVLDRRDATGMPFVATIHPDDGRATGHHSLDMWPIIGHFGIDSDFTLERFLEAYPGHQLEGRPVQ